MLSAAQNRRLTQTGPDTPAGRLLRRYWLPIAVAGQLERQNPLPVTLMGERLVLFRDGRGELGLLDDRCAHRGTSLSQGTVQLKTARVEGQGIRCCYHGWLYGTDGQCLETPGEPEGSVLARNIRIRACPVREDYGFVWAYLAGDDPPALLPVDALAREDGYRVNTIGVWNCNYFQVCENLVDPVHATVLHKATDFEKPFQAVPSVRAEETRFGLRTYAGRPGYERQVEYLFPTAVRLALPFMEPAPMMIFWVVPVTDELCHSFHSWFVPMPDELDDAERRARIERFDAFLYELDDRDPLYHATKINYQDKYACVSQGTVSDRTREHLGKSDRGVLLLRKRFREALAAMERGEEPPGRFGHWPDERLDFPNVN